MQTLNKTALIVDDDIDYLTQMKMTVSNFGFDVITAGSQEEAEKLILTFKPDIAILDLMMENQDSGFVLSYILKKKYPDVPVIIATAVTAETGFMFGLNSNEEKQWIKADLYLEKGLRSDQLQKEMFKLLKI
jgi:DNA-binding response OmpR family regulator